MPSVPPPSLFSPLTLGAFELSHRIVLPALLRGRASPPTGTPNPLLTRYYAQRASPGGLLVTETVLVSARTHTNGHTPGLYTTEQVNGWREVTDAVHARGGLLVAQLGFAASAVPGEAGRAMATLDIDAALRECRDAAENAGDAGFDGIELHAGLAERFLHDLANPRTDGYGGSLPNRLRLLTDLVDTLAGVWRPDRIGVRLSAGSPPSGVDAAARQLNFHGALSEMASCGIAYVHVAPPWPAADGVTAGTMAATLAAAAAACPTGATARLASGGFGVAEAQATVAAGHADAIGFGRAFAANPDLPHRLKAGLALTPWDNGTLVSGGETGYTDYPVAGGEPGISAPRPATG